MLIWFLSECLWKHVRFREFWYHDVGKRKKTNPSEKSVSIRSFFLSVFGHLLSDQLEILAGNNVLLAGGFNAEDYEACSSTFLYQHDLYNLVRGGTCFKNSSKPTSIDLFLTTKNTHFKNSVAVYSGLSDFHKLVLSY